MHVKLRRGRAAWTSLTPAESPTDDLQREEASELKAISVLGGNASAAFARARSNGLDLTEGDLEALVDSPRASTKA